MATKKTKKMNTVQYVSHAKIFDSNYDKVNEFMEDKNISHIDTLQIDNTGAIYIVVYWLA